MSHLLIVKRLELYMDLALYKINILLLLSGPGCMQQIGKSWWRNMTADFPRGAGTEHMDQTRMYLGGWHKAKNGI